MNATLRTFVWGAVPLGSLIGGRLGTLIDVQATIACAVTAGGITRRPWSSSTMAGGASGA
ncbi:MAG: hypothetical protein ACXWNK_15920 [Vulcanimicrobiaceae bacterium]